MNKLDFCQSVEMYITHKRVLSQYSDHYKDYQIAHSMAIVYDLYKMVHIHENNSLPAICKMVIANEQNLLNILPPKAHRHYANQFEIVKSLLNDAKQHLNLLKNQS